MGAGQPFLTTDMDEFLFATLSVDILMQEYAPGGFWAEDPDQISNGPWQSGSAYNILDIANGVDGLPYHSLIADNVGNEPSVSTSDWALCFPCVRWWLQSPGKDIKRQDGKAGRVESQPHYIVCMLDRQRGGFIDKVGGTLGTLKAAQLRLVTLLDARNELFTTADGRTSQFWLSQESSYQIVQSVNKAYDINVGHRYQARVQ